MFDLEDFLIFVTVDCVQVAVALMLLILSIVLIACCWKASLRLATAGVCLLCALVMVKGLYVDYYLVALGEEDDHEAEQAFKIVKPWVSDRQLIRILSEGSGEPNE
jgi:hypothetical protein